MKKRANKVPPNSREELRNIRTELGLTQSAMARLMGMTQSNYCRIETGPRTPTKLHMTLAKAIANGTNAAKKIVEESRG